jgi:hypothetical protein
VLATDDNAELRVDGSRADGSRAEAITAVHRAGARLACSGNGEIVCVSGRAGCGKHTALQTACLSDSSALVESTEGGCWWQLSGWAAPLRLIWGAGPAEPLIGAGLPFAAWRPAIAACIGLAPQVEESCCWDHDAVRHACCVWVAQHPEFSDAAATVLWQILLGIPPLAWAAKCAPAEEAVALVARVLWLFASSCTGEECSGGGGLCIVLPQTDELDDMSWEVVRALALLGNDAVNNPGASVAATRTSLIDHNSRPLATVDNRDSVRSTQEAISGGTPRETIPLLLLLPLQRSSVTREVECPPDIAAAWDPYSSASSDGNVSMLKSSLLKVSSTQRVYKTGKHLFANVACPCVCLGQLGGNRTHDVVRDYDVAVSYDEHTARDGAGGRTGS